MPHVIEPAASARATCRGCGQRIDKGVLRVGEHLPNPYGEGEMTLWFHVPCAAYKRPGVFLEAERPPESLAAVAALESAARQGLEHARVPRIDGAQRAPSGRSHCRHCLELIEKGAWRIRLVFYEEGRFQPSGFIHARCARPFFETTDIMDRLRHFSPQLAEADAADIRKELQ